MHSTLPINTKTRVKHFTHNPANNVKLDYTPPPVGSTVGLARGGSFVVVVDPNSPHCGIRGENVDSETNELTLEFLFRATCTNTSLDGRGFLFDQESVTGYFAGITQCKVSCEVLTSDSMEAIKALIYSENPGCDIIHCELTLSPNSEAHLTVEWINPKYAAHYRVAA